MARKLSFRNCTTNGVFFMNSSNSHPINEVKGLWRFHVKILWFDIFFVKNESIHFSTSSFVVFIINLRTKFIILLVTANRKWKTSKQIFSLLSRFGWRKNYEMHLFLISIQSTCCLRDQLSIPYFFVLYPIVLTSAPKMSLAHHVSSAGNHDHYSLHLHLACAQKKGMLLTIE